MSTATHEDSDGTGYCRGCGTTIGELHHAYCDVQPMHFVCSECGEHTKADEDSCCVHCGADCWVEVCKCEPPN